MSHIFLKEQKSCAYKNLPQKVVTQGWIQEFLQGEKMFPVPGGANSIPEWPKQRLATTGARYNINLKFEVKA